MRETEIKDVQLSGTGITVELSRAAAAIEGQLIDYSERPLRIKDACGLAACVAKSDSNVYTVVISARDRQAPKHSVSLVVAQKEPPTLDEIKANPELKRRYLAGTMTILK